MTTAKFALQKKTIQWKPPCVIAFGCYYQNDNTIQTLFFLTLQSYSELSQPDHNDSTITLLMITLSGFDCSLHDCTITKLNTEKKKIT